MQVGMHRRSNAAKLLGEDTRVLYWSGRRLTGAPFKTMLCALLVLLVAGRARADYKDNFKKGIDAYDRKRWDEVVRHMRDAIRENPAEGERIKLYGLRFEMYFPHFYLGAAYLNQSQCSEAVQEFKISESQGAIRSSPKYAELVDGLKSCEGAAPQVAQFPSTRPPTAPPSAPPATFPTHSPPPTPAPTPSPSLAPTSAPTPTPAPSPTFRPSPTPA